jgi:DNA-binding response OmpR family regulator
MRVLIVEDDPAVGHFLSKGFRESGWEVHLVEDGPRAVASALEMPLDAIVLDLLLPGLHGLEVLRRLRHDGVAVPVVILTALDDNEDVVRGLNLGADDYMVKPFSFNELLARVHAILRRGNLQAPPILRVADLVLDPVRHRVERAGQRIDLTAKEFALLEYLMRNAGQILTRAMILERVFDYHFESLTNVVDVHVYKLRNKVDRGFSRSLIRTVKGVGYVVEPE